MEEKRKVKRRHLYYYLAVTDIKTGEVIGHAIDISNGGIGLISEAPIELNIAFQLKMFMPEEIDGSRYFEFAAESRWCKPDENPDFYNAGFQFKNHSPKAVEIIHNLISNYCLD